MTEVLYKPNELDEFVRGYLHAALWSTNDESTESGGDPLSDNYDIEDIDPASVAGVRDECFKFMRDNWGDLLEYAKRMEHDPGQGTVWDYAGHDFWLTRCGHGVGYWDRGLGELGDRLTAAARLCKEQDIYVGDDKRLYIMGFEDYKGEVKGA